MLIVDTTSLLATLDMVSEAHLYHAPIPDSIRQDIASLIIRRQVRDGKDAGFFIPFTDESFVPFKLFTGEPLHTKLARKHIPLIETARALRFLSLDDPSIVHCLHLAKQCMSPMCYSQFCSQGECKTLSIAYLRYLSMDGVRGNNPGLGILLGHLENYRDGNGRWKGFPFFYCLLMLIEMELPQAIRELQYARPLCLQLYRKDWGTDSISKRRQAILTTALARS